MTLLLFKVDNKYCLILKSVCSYLGYLYSHELNDIDEGQTITQMVRNYNE